MSSDIIRKLKKLKKVNPNTEWKNSCRKFLLSEIKRDTAERQIWFKESFKTLFSIDFVKLTLKPAVSLASVVALVLGGGFSVSASQVSLPGDRLYPLKMVSEKVQVAFAFSDENRARVHVKLAGKRLGEVKKIKEKNGPDKDERINIAIDKFHEEIKTAELKLNDIEEESDALEVAKIFDTKTKEYKEALIEAGSDLKTSKEIAEKISEGIVLAENIGEKALIVIAENSDDANSLISKEDALKSINEKIELIEERVSKIEEGVASIAIEEGDNELTKLLESVDKLLKEGRRVLELARASVLEESIDEAFLNVMESKELIYEAEKISLEAINSVIPQNNVAVNITDEEIIEEEAEKVVVQPIMVKTTPAVEEAVEEVKELDESELKVGIDMKRVIVERN